MEGDIGSMDKVGVRPRAKMIAAVLCLLLILFSLLVMSTHLYAAQLGASGVDKGSKTPTVTVTVTVTDTPTATATATATNTPTPTPTETDTPTPTEVPTDTPTPRPTATNTPAPTPTATATTSAGATPTATTGVTATAGATSTPTQGATAVPTQTTNAAQSPTTLPTTPPSTTNGSSNGGDSSQPGNNGADPLSSFTPFIMGTLIFIGFVGVILMALVLLRKRLMPPQPLTPNLPPSGARPWKRVRTGSLHGLPTLNDNDLIAPQSNFAPGAPLAGSNAAMLPNTSFPPPQPAIFPQNGHGFPTGSTVQMSQQALQGGDIQPPATSIVLTADRPTNAERPEPVTEQTRRVLKPHTRLVKLEKPADTDSNLL